MWPKSTRAFTLLGMLSLTCACGAGSHARIPDAPESKSNGAAMRLNPAEAAMQVNVFEDAAFRDVRVVMAKSMPPQFNLSMTREMPTPGWELRVDALEIDSDKLRIVAHVSEIGPEGISAQVISKAPLRLALGAIKKGRYVLEIHVRRGDEGEHQLLQTFVVNAR